MNTSKTQQKLDTPWGPATSQPMQIAPGVWFVSTPAHGGLMLTSVAAHRLLSARGQVTGRWWRQYLTLEEDVEIAAFIYEQPELFVQAGRPVKADPAEVAKARADAKATLRLFHPAYFTKP